MTGRKDINTIMHSTHKHVCKHNSTHVLTDDKVPNLYVCTVRLNNRIISSTHLNTPFLLQPVSDWNVVAIIHNSMVTIATVAESANKR